MRRLNFGLLASFMLTMMPGATFAADRDADGFSDDAEIAEGTNPDDPHSRPFGIIMSSPSSTTVLRGCLKKAEA